MWKQEITIYHKSGSSWVRYNLEASFRNTSVLNRNKTGVSTSDNALIRFSCLCLNISFLVEIQL